MEVILRTWRLASGWALAIVPTVGLVWGARAAVGVASGLLWAAVNLWALAWVLRDAGTGWRPWWQQALVGLLKGPGLYALGAVAALQPFGSPVGFLAGCSLWWGFVVMDAARHGRVAS